MSKDLKKILLTLLLVIGGGGAAMAADTVAIDTGATAWMLTSTALVLMMVPGLAMFYGGLVRSKNVLGTIMHSFVAMGIISVLWVAVGYAMSFGSNVLGGFFGWNSDYFFLKGIDTAVHIFLIQFALFDFIQKNYNIIIVQ